MPTFLTDLPVIMQWYVVLLLVGILSIPATAKLFPLFKDRGYVFAKIIGVAIPAYVVWLLASIKLLPFTTNTVLFVMVIWGGLNILISRKTLTNYFTTVRKKGLKGISVHIPSWRFMLFEELLFAGFYLFWCYIRAHEPSIHGLEKFMDYGFINAILQSPYFPPTDMWLSAINSSSNEAARYSGGFFINYYYFGHYITAFLTRLSAIPSAITYNLMLSTLLGWSFSASFSIGYTAFSHQFPKALTATKIACGLLAGYLVTFAGNFHTIYLFTKGYPNDNPIPFWQILAPTINMSYWYPNATRFIPNTIHEFPSYSWVVADLHGHVLDIGFVLLTLAVLLNYFMEYHKEKESSMLDRLVHKILSFVFKKKLPSKQIAITLPALLGFLCSILFMTNAWDGLIYLMLSAVSLSLVPTQYSLHPIRSLSQGIKNSAIPIFVLALTFFVCTLPFRDAFKPFVHGVGIVGGWEFARFINAIPSDAAEVITVGPFLLEKGNSLRSPFWMLMVLWGYFYLHVALFIFSLRKQLFKPLSSTKHIGASVLFRIAQLSNIQLFMLFLIGISTLLLIVPEFLYAKDIYPAHYRANTMFKLGYQAFMMLSLVSAFVIMTIHHQLAEHKKTLKVKALKAVILSSLILVGVYPYFSIQSYYGVFSDATRSYDGIDGSLWLQTAHPGDFDAIEFLKKQPYGVIVEAVGDSYTDYGRISSYTGFPTILGWPVHEWLWRGSYDEPGKRVEEVRQFYEAPDTESAKKIVSQYNVKYVIVGKLEREKYVNLNEQVILSLGTVLFKSGETTIYQITQ